MGLRIPCQVSKAIACPFATFSRSAKITGGIYKLDTPITIAQLQGKPVMLVVGKPTPTK